MNVITILGLDIQIENCNYKNDFPKYISNAFMIKKAVINELECIMLIPNDELPNIPTLNKLIENIKQIKKVPVFLKLVQLSSFRRDNLLSNKIPFIFKNDLAYLPFLGTFLTAKHTDATYRRERFTISTQLLFIWILNQRINKYFIMEAMRVLPFSNMTLTRAYRQLTQTNLFEEHKEGRKIFLTTMYTKKELFEKAKSYFISPIVKIGYMKKSIEISELVESGENALSNYTMLKSYLPQVYAIDKKYRNKVVLNEELLNPKEQVKVELWDYNPLIFSEDKKNMDLISLCISLIDIEDERVEVAIERLLTKIWEE